MNNIPKALWYSLSICILILTVVFSFISIKASSISLEYNNKKIEIANEKISLKSDISEIKMLKEKLATISKKLEEKEKLLSNARSLDIENLFKNPNGEDTKTLNMQFNSLSVPKRDFEDISRSLENIILDIDSSQFNNQINHRSQ